MKKLFINKNDGVAEVAERVIASDDAEVSLMIPKNAALSASVANFHLLKREADAAGKHITIESVDENILALAKAADLLAAHPFFEGEKNSSSLSDIVPAKKINDATVSGSPPRKRKRIKEEAAPIKPFVSEMPHTRAEALDGFKKKIQPEAVPDIKYEELPPPSWFRARAKLIFRILGAAVVLAAIVWTINSFFSRAAITIDFKKTPWTYEHAFTADASAAKANLDRNILPAELFTADKNLTKLFPASAVKRVSQKATGKITIYNAYSSKPQSLVASTRFVTPDGKIFRITDRVIVPGAQISGGTIEPASIDAGVAADQPGPDYNVGPVSKLVIPGFKGTPKYAGFYGELKEGTSGGFVGQKAVPTADDIQNAKDKTTEILKTTLQSNFLTSYPPEFKILDGASSFSITKLNVNENTDAGGNFSVFGEANVAAVGFREADLRSFLVQLTARNNPNTVFKELNLSYSNVAANFTNKSLSFTLSAQGVLTQAFSADDFKTKILGLKIYDARLLVSALPGLADARISLWPIWLGRIPADTTKVKIVVN